jgi:hypothetical protein
VNLQRLSSDGRFLLQLGAGVSAGALGLAVIDLRSGRERLLPNLTWTFAELSPDDATVAVRDNQMLTVVDVATGHTPRCPPASAAAKGRRRRRGSVGLVSRRSADCGEKHHRHVRGRSRGHLEVRLHMASTVNGSQSWSPDGGSLLLYDKRRVSVYRVADVRGGGSTDLATPARGHPSARLGRRADRLAGRIPRSQQLVTTDRTGHDEALWTRLDVGNRAVYSVTWSRALSG